MAVENARNEYTFATLIEEDLLANPYDQFKLWLEEAEKLSITEYNAFALATSDLKGCPSLRMLLLRGIRAGGLVFYSNRTSKKGQHLEENPQAEMLFFWRDMNRQIRIRGGISTLSTEEADAYFQSRTLGSQQATATSNQSQPIASRQELDQKLKDAQKKFFDYVPTPEAWTGYQLAPEYWEFWQGRSKRFHDRLCYLQEPSGWKIQRLQP